MLLLDANVLVGAFRPDEPAHAQLKAWLEGALHEGLEITFPAIVEVAFLRIVTHPRIFQTPSSLEEALEFLQALHESGQFRDLQPTPRMRGRWWRWCRELSLAGNDVNDAYLAAAAAELHCRLCTRDRGFSRFKGLDWWDPIPSA